MKSQHEGRFGLACPIDRAGVPNLPNRHDLRRIRVHYGTEQRYFSRPSSCRPPVSTSILLGGFGIRRVLWARSYR